MRCSICGADNREIARFCDSCGAPSAALPRRPPPLTPPLVPSASGELRRLTVLFCDLVGSTEIAALLDPEEWRKLIASYHRAATEAITQFGGYVAQYLGDGVMAYFGWPEAHNNSAESAARAGLAIVEKIAKLDRQYTHGRLSVRVGIHFGPAVIGRVSKEADVFGDTSNIAARVQTVAVPNSVLITADTERLISGLFIVEDCAAQVPKGIGGRFDFTG
jgi:class 3 adenylate cyclase